MYIVHTYHICNVNVYMMRGCEYYIYYVYDGCCCGTTGTKHKANSQTYYRRYIFWPYILINLVYICTLSPCNLFKLIIFCINSRVCCRMKQFVTLNRIQITFLTRISIYRVFLFQQHFSISIISGDLVLHEYNTMCHFDTVVDRCRRTRAQRNSAESVYQS